MRGLGCICDETDLNLSGSGGRIQIVTIEKETSGETVLGEALQSPTPRDNFLCLQMP